MASTARRCNASRSARSLGTEAPTNAVKLAANVDAMRQSRDPDIRRLLGVLPGNGKVLGLDERWAYHIIKAVGNYGEAFDRNVGQGGPIKLPRGLNRLWTQGGLMYAPPLR